MRWLLQRWRWGRRERGAVARCDVVRGDAGQAVLLLLPVVAFVAMLSLAAVRAGATVVDRGRAQAAADAAALAAVAGGTSAAVRVAAANGATVTRVATIGSDVAVTVVLRGVAATARATNGP